MNQSLSEEMQNQSNWPIKSIQIGDCLKAHLQPTALLAAEQFSYMKILPEAEIKFIQLDCYDKQCEFPQQKQTVEKPVG